MPTFDVEPTTIPAFEVDSAYLFTQYFEDQELFRELSEYYNSEHYRFEVPAEDLDTVRDSLEAYYYELEIVDDLEAYCVVKEQYTSHAEILKQSVQHWTRDGYNFFLMKDTQAVDYAIEQGATQIADTEFVLGI